MTDATIFLTITSDLESSSATIFCDDSFYVTDELTMFFDLHLFDGIKLIESVSSTSHEYSDGVAQLLHDKWKSLGRYIQDDFSDIVPIFLKAISLEIESQKFGKTLSFRLEDSNFKPLD